MQRLAECHHISSLGPNVSDAGSKELSPSADQYSPKKLTFCGNIYYFRVFYLESSSPELKESSIIAKIGFELAKLELTSARTLGEGKTGAAKDAAATAVGEVNRAPRSHHPRNL